ncbi:MAG: hypothetical protein OXG44_02125 [Gammaproteobacteria bacterium]|nr:hypothetical protein [Gammaproteobacteria bacterium]
MAVSERDRSYFRRMGEWKANLPAAAPPPPRSFDQVYEAMMRIQRGLSPPPTHGDDAAAVKRLTEFRDRLLELDARGSGKHNAKRR